MKPLTKKQRFLSIVILGIIFVVLAPIIILSSFGYKIDAGLVLQKTGGIFVHSTISNASVFLNDKYIKDNGLFARNILIQDLTPNKTYSIRIQKEGYQSWVKDIFIYPSIVSESRILMLPNTYQVREIFPFVNEEGIGTYTPPKKLAKPSNKEFIETSALFESVVVEKTVSKSVVKNTKTTSLSSPIESTPVEEVEVTKTKLDLFFESINIEDQTKLKNLIINGKEASWLTDSGIILYWTDTENLAPYYYCGGIDRECKTNLTLNWPDIKRFDYFPGRNEVWIVLAAEGIFAVEVDDRSQRNVQSIYKGKDLDFRLTQGGRLIIKDQSKFFEINL